MTGSNDSTQNIETLNKDNERKKNEKSSLRRVTKIAFVVSVEYRLFEYFSSYQGIIYDQNNHARYTNNQNKSFPNYWK
jgi:hypothetical protein